MRKQGRFGWEDRRFLSRQEKATHSAVAGELQPIPSAKRLLMEREAAYRDNEQHLSKGQVPPATGHANGGCRSGTMGRGKTDGVWHSPSLLLQSTSHDHIGSIASKHADSHAGAKRWVPKELTEAEWS